jgi:hypothetical protein
MDHYKWVSERKAEDVITRLEIKGAWKYDSRWMFTCKRGYGIHPYRLLYRNPGSRRSPAYTRPGLEGEIHETPEGCEIIGKSDNVFWSNSYMYTICGMICMSGLILTVISGIFGVLLVSLIGVSPLLFWHIRSYRKSKYEETALDIMNEAAGTDYITFQQ